MTGKQKSGPLWKLRQFCVLLEAMLTLAAARFLVFFVPLKYWRKSLGAVMAEPSGKEPVPAAGGSMIVRARGVSRKVTHAASLVPFEAVCLPQAMAARWMLSRRGIKTRLFLGAKRSEEGSGLAFHAWLMLGDVCLTGASERAEFNAFHSGKKAVT